jgi:DNA-binding HxlR family transcriptional regulator
MTTIDVLVKKAPPGNLVSQREPPAAPPDPYSSGCPTRLLLDRIGDKWMVLTLGLIRDRPRRFNALRRDIQGVTQKMLSQTLKQMERDGLITRTVKFSTGSSSGRAITSPPCSPLGGSMTEARVRTAGRRNARRFGRPSRSRAARHDLLEPCGSIITLMRIRVPSER